MGRPRRKKGTQKNWVETIQIYAPSAAEVKAESKAITRDAFDARVVQLVMDGHTVGAAERIAAGELLRGQQPPEHP